MAVLGEQGGDPDLEQLVPEILAVSAEPPIPTSWTRPAWLMTSSTRAKVALSSAWVVSTMELIFLGQLLGHGLQIVVAADAVVEIPYVVGLDGVLAPQILADRQLEGGEALEPDLLGELHYARLADVSLLGQLLGGEVGHLLRARQDVIGDLELAGES